MVVEAYDGVLELLSADPEEREAARGLGLPLGDIAARLGARITVLAWSDWLRYETNPGAFFDWCGFPASRAVVPPGPMPNPPAQAGVTFREIPARDPGHGDALSHRRPSPKTLGLLADNDPLFLLSVSLNDCLENLLLTDPFQAVIVPNWGGCGYQAQMLSATSSNPLSDVAFATVVTGTSRQRHAANNEGLWTRPAIVRRQMEDMSLGLSDLVLAFGPNSVATAHAGRLASASDPIVVPRFIPPETMRRLSTADQPAGHRIGQILLREPLDGASGALVTLDAIAMLSQERAALPCPVTFAGPAVRFGPMAPKDFRAYWSSRGFVRALEDNSYLSWSSAPAWPVDSASIRLFPSHFEHLPSPWIAAAHGDLPVVSAAALDGVARVAEYPGELFVGDPSPSRLSRTIRDLADQSPLRLGELRRDLCAAFVSAQSSVDRSRGMDALVDALDRLMERKMPRQPLDHVARLLLDRTVTLRQIDPPVPVTTDCTATLTVVVTCHNMGKLITETMESVWRSERLPDEVLVVDDGSDDPVTLDHLAALGRECLVRNLPLQIIRQSNRGLANARNAGLRAASGEFVSFLDGDDLIEPEFYRLALAVAVAGPALGGVAAWAYCFGDEVNTTFWNAPQPELPLLLVENLVIVPCLMRTALLRDLGGYDPVERYNYEDWELAVRLLASGHPIVTIPRYLERYRIRGNSLYRTMSPVQNQVMREEMLATHRTTASRFGPEVAMQLEHRLMQRIHALPVGGVARGPRSILRRTRGVLADMIARFLWRRR